MIVSQNSKYHMMGDLKSRPVIGFRVTPDLIITLRQIMHQYAYIIIGATFFKCFEYHIHASVVSVLSYGNVQIILLDDV
jgi:hypothetical protein